MKKLMIGSLLIAALVGCSSNRVIVDTKGVDMPSYTADLQECETYAAQVPVGEEVAKGAVRGGAVWGAVGAIFGNSRTAARGVGAGAVTGGAKGGAKAEREQQQVVKSCMRGRGYKVLN